MASMTLSIIIAVIVLVMGEGMGATPFILHQLTPVLSLTWDQICAESSPLDLHPFPSSFPSLDAYATVFQSSLLEELRQSLGHRLRQDSPPDFQSFPIFNVPADASGIHVHLHDPQHQLQFGDIVLLSAQPPTESLPSCTLAVIADRSFSTIGAFMSKSLIDSSSSSSVSVGVLMSAIPTLSRLESLQLHRWHVLYSEPDLDVNLRARILSGVTAPDPIPQIAHDHGASVADLALSVLRHSDPVVLVNGVPGTGKSTFVRCLCLSTYLLLSEPRVLVVAPSNAALEVLAHAWLGDDRARIPKRSVGVLLDADAQRRYRDLDRFDPRVWARDHYYRVDRLIERISEIQARSAQETSNLGWSQDMIDVQVHGYVADVIRKTWPSIQDTLTQLPALETLLRQIQTSSDASSALQLIRELRSAVPLDQLAGEYAANAQILFTTVTCLRTTPILQFPCDLAIVDDGAHVPELDLRPLWKTSLKRVVLVGDLREPPSAGRTGAPSLMQRMAAQIPIHTLTQQYRLSDEIAAFSMQTFYGDAAIDANRSASMLQFVAHSGSADALSSDGLENRGEVDLIRAYLSSLLERYPQIPMRIGLIVPSVAQERRLQQALCTIRAKTLAQIWIGQADDFRGHEFDLVLVSLTATSTISAMALTASHMNLALTRSKSGLWVFGDYDVFARTPSHLPWSLFADFCRSRGYLRIVDATGAKAAPLSATAPSKPLWASAKSSSSSGASPKHAAGPSPTPSTNAAAQAFCDDFDAFLEEEKRSNSRPTPPMDAAQAFVDEFETFLQEPNQTAGAAPSYKGVDELVTGSSAEASTKSIIGGDESCGEDWELCE